jgi:hypothetical protein
MRPNLRLLTCLAFAVSGPCLASGALNGTTVDSVIVGADALAIVKFATCDIGHSPGCVIPGYASALAIDTNTAGGRSILATVLSAKAAGTVVYVGGTGTCGKYPAQMEDLYWIWAH